MANRMKQLGISRRELAKRARISRQTLHYLEHESDRNVTDETFKAVDFGLFWSEGTAKGFYIGQVKDVHSGENMDQQILQYLKAILSRLETMDIDDLEREVIMLETEAFGKGESEHPSTKQISAFIGRMLRALADESQETDGGPIAR